MKLLGISLGTLLIAALVWTTLWFWGQSLTYKPYDHALTNWTTPSEEPLLAISTDSPEEAANFLKTNPDGIIVLNLKISGDAHFFTTKSGDLDFITKLPETNPDEYKGNKYFYYSFDYLTKHSTSLTSIKTWITLKPRFWIFNILDNAIDIDKNLIQFLEEKGLQNKAVITSDTDLVISSIKNSRPLWVYGTSLSDLTKLLTMASVNLETLVNFKRDFFISPVTLKNRNVLNPKVIAEMRRRFKKVAIGPVHTDQDREIALKHQPDILILGSSLANSLSQ